MSRSSKLPSRTQRTPKFIEHFWLSRCRLAVPYNPPGDALVLENFRFRHTT